MQELVDLWWGQGPAFMGSCQDPGDLKAAGGHGRHLGPTELASTWVSLVPGFVAPCREIPKASVVGLMPVQAGSEFAVKLHSHFILLYPQGRFLFPEQEARRGGGVMGGNVNVFFLPSSVHIFLFLCSAQVL